MGGCGTLSAVDEACLCEHVGGFTGRTMTEQIDDGEPVEDESTFGLTPYRRTALKGAGAGLAALGMGGFATTTTAHHKDDHGDDSGGESGGSAANQFRFAGEEWTVARATSDPGERVSDIVTLLELHDVKQSNSWQDSLYLNTSIESSLLTEVQVSGSEDTSRSVAGVFGWIEIRPAGGGPNEWRMITADDEQASPPTAAELENILDDQNQGLPNLTKGVVAFNTRDFELEWDLVDLVEQAMFEVIEALDEIEDVYGDYSDYQDAVAGDSSYSEHENTLVDAGVDPSTAESYVSRVGEAYTWSEYQTMVADATSWDELEAALLDLDIFLRAYLKTKSANGFNWVTTGTAGDHDLRLRGALVVLVSDDDPEDVHAQAVVGSRTMIAQPVKIKAAISSREDPNS